MATIKDIAKAAGVAQGTVSNVLNGKGNVSSDKIKHVLAVAASLDYTPNTRAKYLRAGKARIITIILPNIISKQYIEFYLSFKNYAESHDYTVNIYLTNDRSETELSIISKVKASMASGIAAITCLNNTYHAYQELNNYPYSKIVFVERNPDPQSNFIGFDYSKAGTSLASEAIKHNYTNIVLITGNLKHSNEADFYHSFMQAITKTDCSVHHIQTDHYRKNQNIMQMFSTLQPEAVFISNYSFAENVKDIGKNFYQSHKLKIYTVSPLFTMPENDFYKYELNYRLLGKTVAKSLINSIENKSDQYSMILENNGYRNWFANIKQNISANPINVLTLDSPEAYTMKNLSRIYTQKTGIKVNITVYSYDEIYDAFMNMSETSAFDVIRLDVTWLSWFAEKILMPLEKVDPDIAAHFDQFIDGLAEQYSIINNQIYALPSTPSVQLLFYRKDLFNNTMLKRIYFETYKKELLPPTTFAEFNQIAKFFTKSINPSSPVDYGATLTLGSTGVAGSEFLARYFSYNKNLFNKNGKVQLNSDISLMALEQLIEIKKYSNKTYNTWWTNTAKSFSEGNVAMSILYSNYASDLLNSTSKVVDNIGCSIIPGSNPVIGGGSLGISKYSKNPEAALQFLKWICSEPISSASTLLGSVSACKKTYDNYEIIDTFPWLKLAKDCFALSHGKRTPDKINLPFDERRFLSIVGMAVKNSYSGAMKPKEALDIAQDMFKKDFNDLY